MTYEKYFDGLIELFGEEGIKKFINDLNKMIKYTNNYLKDFSS